MKELTEPVKSQEARDLEAWEIAQKIHIGEAIPKRDQRDLRSDLFFRYTLDRDYFARQANFAAAVCSSMSNDIKDAIKHRKTNQAKFDAGRNRWSRRIPKRARRSSPTSWTRKRPSRSSSGDSTANTAANC